MAKIRLETGEVLNFDGTPTQEQIEDAVSQLNLSVSTKQPPVESSGGSGAKDAAALVGVGAGLYEAGRQFYKPARQIKAKEKLLGDIKKSYLNEPMIASQDIPSQIEAKGRIEQQKLNMQKTDIKEKITNIRFSKERAEMNLSRYIQDFDDKVLSQSVEGFANTMKDAAPKFFNDTYKNYGAALDSIESGLVKSGKQLSSNAFVSEVIQQTVDDALKIGIQPDKLNKLISIMDDAAGDTSLFKGNNALQPLRTMKNASIEQLKGTVASLKKEIPKEAVFKLTENWGKFLENNVPEAAKELSGINKNYGEVAKMRNAIYKIVDPATGDFDKTKLNRFIYGYAKSKVNTGAEEVVRLLSEGNELVAGNVNVGKAFAAVKKAKVARAGIQSSSKQIASQLQDDVASLSQRLSAIQKQIEQSKLNTDVWANKAQTILSEQKAIAIKHPTRGGSLGKSIARGGAVGERALIASMARKMTTLATIVPMITSAFRFKEDPAVGWGSAVGIDVPAKGTKERAVLENKINNVPIPEDLKVSEKERFNILYNYGLAL